MTAPLTSTDPVSDRLSGALRNIDRLLRVETRRSNHMVLQAVRADLAYGIAHLGSPDGTGAPR